VLSVAFSHELKQELEGKAFSILVDETTDTSTAKLLAVLVRHCDQRSGQMVDDLLGLVEVESATAESLFKAIKGKYDPDNHANFVTMYKLYMYRYRDWYRI